MELLQAVARGDVPAEAAMAQLAGAPVAELGEATLDMHRALRQGFPEVVLAPGKTEAQLLSIVERLAAAGQGVLITRLDDAQRAALRNSFPQMALHEAARTGWIEPTEARPVTAGRVLVVTAGTSDLPVAQEAMVTLAAYGVSADLVADVGVAGVHRLTPHLPHIQQATAMVVVAGMDGALASVVGGIASCPVIAVPTSTGYGASMGGLSALLAMLSSCAAGLSVVNIDNGFGAGVAAARVVLAVESARGGVTQTSVVKEVAART